jgi:hypothetical protein
MVKEVGLFKFVPLIVINVPTGPDVGLKDEIIGTAATVVCITRSDNMNRRTGLDII